ncbi:lipopolysaccharide biosynthesis protein [Mucilaginibacter sp. HMF5004]|uniref:exopolysaccharide transport family protein n=1 Tax=Mucilaginibacter rivuli TaxID=2857527 RepID=UPI001C5F9C0C|nr:lipopolysaccharide biosynthesis protein [Mucilaginibacter rivuli]MBW4890923.1 lipopolysaccharide biosynthesis protein [Mucilaginibacter rivuli]
MELKNFKNLLKRFKLALLLIPLATVIVTYFLVRKLPNVYSSQSQIATGIVNESQNLLTQVVGESQANQKFSNMIAILQTKKLLKLVSYKLILHDLTSPAPFRTSKDFLSMNASARKHAIEVYNNMYATQGTLSLDDPDQNGLDRVLGSMKYDPGSIASKLNVYRSENSDFITVAYESENSQLCAFVVNTLIKEFTTYYTAQTKQNQDKDVAFLDSLLKKKKTTMDSSISSLKQYKIKNHILSLSEQARSLYTQLAAAEDKKQQAEKDVIAYTGSINNIDRQFNPTDKKYIESTLMQVNSSILANKQKLAQLTDLWIKNNHADSYKHSIDSLQDIITRQINESIDKSINTPLSTKSALISQKLTLQVTLDIARFSIKSLSDEILRLHQRLDVLVPNEAVIQSLENDADVKTREYLEVLQKDNQITMQSSYNSKLQQVDVAVPEPPQASKKMLLVILSGMVSFMICMLFLFVLYYIDHSIKQPKALANVTDIPVLGVLYRLPPQTIDIKELLSTDNGNETAGFKDQLRSIRFEIDQEFKNNKILALTSLIGGEGKTLMALSLAQSYSIIGKKVLVIDGNFDSRTISTTLPLKNTIEDYFKYSLLNSDAGVTVLGNKGGDQTLLEIQDERTINERLTELKQIYDLIIIEAPALDKMNKAKEWLLFADKVIGVFEADQTLTENKRLSIKYLKSLGDKFGGWIFNKMNPVNNI